MSAAPCIGLQKGSLQQSQWSLRHLPGNVGHRFRTQVGTNMRTGWVNSLPKKWSHIFIMFSAVSDSTIFSMQTTFNWFNRSPHSGTTMLPWASRLIISSPTGRVRRMATTCEDCDLLCRPAPPQNMNRPAIRLASWATVISPWEKCGTNAK